MRLGGSPRRIVYQALGLAICAATFTGCSVKQNQQSPIESPSGKYELRMPKREVPGRSTPETWQPEVWEKGGDRLLLDITGFDGDDELYWVWDDDDRIWIYSSRRDEVDIIERLDSVGGDFWRRIWTGRHPCANDTKPCPPLDVYPDAVRQRIAAKGR